MRALQRVVLICGLALLITDVAAQQHPAVTQEKAGTDLEQIHGYMKRTWHSHERR